MSAGQAWLLAAILCFFVAVVLSVVVMHKMWTANVNWLVPIILTFYFGGFGCLIGLLFAAVRHI